MERLRGDLTKDLGTVIEYENIVLEEEPPTEGPGASVRPLVHARL